MTIYPYQTRYGHSVPALILDVPAGKNLYAYRQLMSVEDFLKLWGKFNGVPVRFREIIFNKMAERAGVLAERALRLSHITQIFGYRGVMTQRWCTQKM
jgi:hypothetical protein